MAKCTRKPDDSGGPDEAAPTIPHMILLPERFGTGRCGTPGHQQYRDAVEAAARKLAARFVAAYVVMATGELRPLAEHAEPTSGTLAKLPSEKRHRVLLELAEGINASLKPGMRVVCLVAGPDLRSIRRLGIPMFVPLAGMDVLMRRRWLEAMANATDFVIGYTLFGGAAEPSTAVAFTGGPAEIHGAR